jgi:hypothetical protein
MKQQLAEIDAVIKGICYHQAQRLRGFRRQTARQQVWAVTTLFNGLKHAVFGLLADIAVPGKHPETVAFDTPARFATSSIVVILLIPILSM